MLVALRNQVAAQLYADLAGIPDLGGINVTHLDGLLARVRQLVTRAELSVLVEQLNTRHFQEAGEGYMREWGFDRWRWETGPDGHLWDAVAVIPVGECRLLGTGEILVTEDDWRLEEEQERRFQHGQDCQDVREQQLQQQIERWESDKEGTILRFVLGRLHLEARRLIYHVHKKPDVPISEPPYFALARLKQVVVTSRGYDFVDGMRDPFSPSLLHDLLHERRKPFGVCARKGCEHAFVQPDRGRPRRYCSHACKERSMPCRADNTGKVRKRRRKVRRAEIREVGALLQRTDKRLWLRRVQRKFPKKTERQCKRLIRIAEVRHRARSAPKAKGPVKAASQAQRGTVRGKAARQ